jgi:hypothetical protein
MSVTSSDGYTEQSWASTLLSDVGVPVTSQNINDIIAWMSGENPPSDWYHRNNPLNESYGNGSTDGTGSNANLTVGAANTAHMINQTNMTAIKAGLESGTTSVQQFYYDASSSPWASSHYGNPAIAGSSGSDDWGGATASELAADATNAASGQSASSSSPGSATSTTSATPTSTESFPGAANMLALLDQFMNPAGPTLSQSLSSLGTDNIKNLVQIIFARGMFSVFFGALTFYGIHRALNGGGTLGSAIGVAQRQRSLGQRDTALDIAQQSEERKGVTSVAAKTLEKDAVEAAVI